MRRLDDKVQAQWYIHVVILARYVTTVICHGHLELCA